MNVTKWQHNMQFEILTLTVQKLHHWLWKWPYTVSWHEKQIKSCKKQIDIQVYINCIHVDLKKTYLEMQRPTEKQELVNRWPL